MTQSDEISKPKRGWRWLLIALLFLSLFFALLTLDRTPSIEASPPPDAAQVRAAKDLFELARAVSKYDQPMRMPVSWDQLKAAGALSGHIGGVRRVSFAHIGDQLEVQASIPAFWGLWLNVNAIAEPSAQGFPPMHGSVGRLSIPNWAVRSMIWVGRKFAKWRGLDIPPPDQIVHSLEIKDDAVVPNVLIPRDAKRFFAMALNRDAPLDPDLISQRYCAIGENLAANPTIDFSEFVRRAFSTAPDLSEATNRANFVALAMLVISKQAGELAGVDRANLKTCPRVQLDPLLDGRVDLPKHWAMSAAMAATLGEHLSDTMGVWKEISDSGPTGSGFSFVDLSADRSGIHFARRAVDPASAESTARHLQSITQEELLPIRALMFAEGMTEAQFRARYQSIDSGKYAEMVKKIDAILKSRD